MRRRQTSPRRRRYGAGWPVHGSTAAAGKEDRACQAQGPQPGAHRSVHSAGHFCAVARRV